MTTLRCSPDGRDAVAEATHSSERLEEDCVTAMLRTLGESFGAQCALEG